MKNRTVIAPTGALNTDDDPRYLPEGDYLELLNMSNGISQEQGHSGMIETFLNHFGINIPCETPATFKELAWGRDIEHDIAYILGHQGGATPYFEIYKFDTNTDVVTKIYRGLASMWGITANTLIVNPKILDDKLVWTDGVNPVYYVDLKRIEVSFINSIGLTPISKWNATTTYSINQIVYFSDSYFKSRENLNLNNNPLTTPLRWELLCKITEAYGNIVDINIFKLSANPPLISADVNYISNPNIHANNLRQKTFQVSYRYVYMDYRRSTYVSPSIVPAPNQQESIDGVAVATPTHHNGLCIKVNTGTEEVRAIEIIARTSEDLAAWFDIGRVNIIESNGVRAQSPRTMLDYFWYNDSVKENVDIRKVYNLFTYIPVSARHIEMIEGNRLVFANITEGYNGISTQVSINLTYEDLSLTSTEFWDLFISPRFASSFRDPIDRQLYIVYNLVLILPLQKTVGIYRINIESNTAIFNYDGIGAYPSTVKNGLVASINANGWGAALITNTNSYEMSFFEETVMQGETPYAGRVYSATVETPTVNTVNKYPILKSGTTHHWGIIYRDAAGRMFPVSGARDIEVYVPYPTENVISTINKRAVIDFNINHLPPAKAEYYEIVYLGNRNIAWFLQLRGNHLQYGKRLDSPNDPALTNIDTRFLRISLADMYVDIRNKLPNWSVEQYVWEKGDRIRIIGVMNDVGIVTEESQIFDSEITGVFNNTDFVNPASGGATIIREYLYFQIIPGFAFMTTPHTTRGFNDYFVEIYRPYKETSVDFYYTTGMTFEIGTDVNGNRFHKGNTNQTLTVLGVPNTPAIVRNTAHDGWKYLRNFADKITKNLVTVWSESEYASDFYLSSKLTSSGIPIPAFDSSKQVVLTKRLRHGGKYNFGTELNEIAEFEYDKFIDVKDEHGPIEGIREVGFILKVLQHDKISSIYISRIEAHGGTDDTQFLFTDRVFGSLRPGIERYGTRHPESICVMRNHLYFWDQKEGAVIRDAPNGAFPISSYKMFRFFMDKAKQMDGYVTQEVYFSFNVETDMLYCTFGNGTIYETIIFSERETRWKFSTDCIIRKPFWFGKRMFHVARGVIYEWWRAQAPQGFLRLSGEDKTGRWTTYSNAPPVKLKHFDAVAVYQKGDVPSVLVIVPEKGSAVNREMESIVASWKNKQGVFYGSILRDRNTPGIQNENNRLMNGLRLRGQYCKLIFNFTQRNRPTRLLMAVINSTDA